MKVKFSPWLAAIACVPILSAQVLVAQPSTTIQLFGPVNAVPSITGTSSTNPYAFNTNTLNLTCPVSGTQAILSGPLATIGSAPTPPFSPGGNLLVDNSLILTVTLASAPTADINLTPANVCPATNYTEGTGGLYNNDCFNATYQGNAGSLASGNQDPDTYLLSTDSGMETVDLAGGVGPIDIHGYLTAAASASNPSLQVPVNVQIAPTDEGGSYTSSTIFLTTNCTQGPVTGPAQLNGNPITTGASQTQTFTFNSGNNENVVFTYDVSPSQSAGTLNPTTIGGSPINGDLPFDSTLFQANLVPQTSFATSNCFIHLGEALPSGKAACKIYTLVCSTPGSNAAPSGAQCPISSAPNEHVSDYFDGPKFTLQSIFAGDDIFNEGIGFLMASDSWDTNDTVPPNKIGSTAPPTGSGGPCTFSGDATIEALPCPQNLLINFYGPGAFNGDGETNNPNSTFIGVYGVPEDKTSVKVSGELPDAWVNSANPTVSFSTEAPNFTKGAHVQSLTNPSKLVPLPGAASFIPAPIKSITYGVIPPGTTNAQLPLPINESMLLATTDTTLTSGANCAATPFTALTVPNFTPTPQRLTLNQGDGPYFLHYYSQDCAGTQELLFTEAPNTGYWSTNFYSIPIQLDTHAPKVTSLTLTPAPAATGPYAGVYKAGTTVTAKYSCSDQNSEVPNPYGNGTLNTGSGVVLCGTYVYLPESTYTIPVGSLSTQVSTSTKTQKTFTFTVNAIDGAGNNSSQAINYTVKP